ncbi:hypothetical protein [Bacillus sp. FJAT-22090]|uniref:hypothetical protein n=1 Tax=Bacillus sp. FJAT-22090 TaxID=1581038 RepID=UPI0028CB16B5|nr:hypothetical protein [Bacillus sp. FJAT-22090]
MPKYRKKPVVIEAIKADLGTSVTAIVNFIGVDDVRIEEDGSLFIKTLEGDMRVTPGDYIIKGIKGEFYPCKPDIFEATYEQVIESNLLSSVIKAYGFTVEQAQTMLSNKEIKEILISNMQRTKVSPLRTATATVNVDIDGVINTFSKKLEEELAKSL